MSAAKHRPPDPKPTAARPLAWAVLLFPALCAAGIWLSWGWELLGLYTASLVAATLLPAQSEMVLVGLHVSGRFHPALLVAVATFGNVLGACINWLLGRYLLHFQDRRWFPVKQQALERATRHYNRYGLWSLMLAWAPIIGDPLTVVAGFLRTPFWLFTLLVLIGKGGRYALLVGLF